jgi:hypothetical protein
MKFSFEQFKDIPGQIQLFKNYFGRLTEREQAIVLATTGGGILFVMFLIYTTFWGLTVRMSNKIDQGHQILSSCER